MLLEIFTQVPTLFLLRLVEELLHDGLYALEDHVAPDANGAVAAAGMHLLIKSQHCFYMVREHLTIAEVLAIYY